MNEFVNKVIELWEDNKEYGLSIKAGRQMGKTTAVLEIAKKESERGKNTTIICHNFETAKTLSYHYAHKYGETNRVRFTDIGRMNILNDNDYIFYDDCLDGGMTAGVMFIGTQRNNEFIFGDSWYDRKIPDDLKNNMGESTFNQQFNCGILYSTPNWKERYSK